MRPSMRSLALRISLRKDLPSSLSTSPHSSSSASVNPLRMRSGPRRSWPAADVNDSSSLLLAAMFVLEFGQVLDAWRAAPRRCASVPSGTSCTRAMKCCHPVGAPRRAAMHAGRAPRSASCAAVPERTPPVASPASACGVATKQLQCGGIRGADHAGARRTAATAPDAARTAHRRRPYRLRLAGQDFFHEVRHMPVATRNRQSGASLDSAGRKLCARARNSAARRV